MPTMSLEKSLKSWWKHQRRWSYKLTLNHKRTICCGVLIPLGLYAWCTCSTLSKHKKIKKLFHNASFRGGWESRRSEVPYPPDITYLPPLTQPTNEAPDDSYGGYVENSEDDRVERECTSKDGISGAKVTQMSKVGLSWVLLNDVHCTHSQQPLTAVVYLSPATSTSNANFLTHSHRHANGSPPVTMSNLPLDIDWLIYSHSFLPSCFHVFGEYTEPFSITHSSVISQLVEIFRKCFPNICHDLTSSSMTFLVVSWLVLYSLSHFLDLSIGPAALVWSL